MISDRYHCFNRPRPTPQTTIPCRVGWIFLSEPGLSRILAPIVEDLPHTMSCDCQYDRSTVDAKCAGCNHAKQDKGETA